MFDLRMHDADTDHKLPECHFTLGANDKTTVGQVPASDKPADDGMAIVRRQQIPESLLGGKTSNSPSGLPPLKRLPWISIPGTEMLGGLR